MFCYYVLEVCSFLMRNRKEVDLDVKGGREYSGYSVQGKIAFNKRQKRVSATNQKNKEINKIKEGKQFTV